MKLGHRNAEKLTEFSAYEEIIFPLCVSEDLVLSSDVWINTAVKAKVAQEIIHLLKVKGVILCSFLCSEIHPSLCFCFWAYVTVISNVFFISQFCKISSTYTSRTFIEQHFKHINLGLILHLF